MAAAPTETWTKQQENWAAQVVPHDRPDNRAFDDPDLLVAGSLKNNAAARIFYGESNRRTRSP